jgi:hypothetical protein
MKKESFWGKGVWILYGGFVLFILGCVAVVAVQHIDLVESDYYEKGLDYQKQIKRIEMGSNEAPSVGTTLGNKGITINFNPEYISRDFKGKVLLFRPSDARLDFEIPLKLDSLGYQDIRDSRLQKGYWRVKISWQADGDSYYSEHQVFIG